MNDRIKKAAALGAGEIVADTEDLADALGYTGDLASDVNADLGLGYGKDSDSYGVLYKECETAIRQAYQDRLGL